MEQNAPSQGMLNVVLNTIGKITVKVFDTNGRFAKKMCKDLLEGMQQLEINISDLAEGTYIFNAFKGDTFITSFKFKKLSS